MQKLLFPEIDNQTAVMASVVNQGNIMGALLFGVTKRNEIDASKSEAVRIVENLVGFLKGLDDDPDDKTKNGVISIFKALSSEKLKQVEEHVKTKYSEDDDGKIVIDWITQARS
jgi:hypothetical protein